MSRALSGRTTAPPASAAAERLIGGRFAVDPAQPLPGAGGGLPAFHATDRSDVLTGLMAVQTRSDAPPRAAAFASPLGEVPGLLVPLAQGPAAGADGRPAWFVICRAPPGPPLWPAGQTAVRPWAEAELLRLLIAPVAAALEALRAQRLTHRAVRPDNLFRATASEPVVLGCAWATPPALLQPAAFEPPYVAMCLPSGRGEGSVADDVYALGVTALALALGRMPWAGLGDDELVRRKLEHGSFAALSVDARLPPALADLLRAMLAEDPAQRPPPALLLEPSAARARRVAARPGHRAQRALQVGEVTAWDARGLAYAIARDPAAGVRLLRNGGIDHWLRRNLDDTTLAARLEDALRRRQTEAVSEEIHADSLLALRAVALLDPLAPVCWEGLALWPDGLGPALAVHAKPDDATSERLYALIAAEAGAAHASLRGAPEAQVKPRLEARSQRLLLQRRGWAGGPARLTYALNPFLPCRSPLLGGALVARLEELLPALEAALASATPAAPLLLDADLIAFIAARQQGGLEPLLAVFTDGLGASRAALAQVRLLAKLQADFRIESLPKLATALAVAARPSLESWRSRTRRAEKEARLEETAKAGDLGALLRVLDDPAAREADMAGLNHAIASVARIDAALTALAERSAGQGMAARALGREIAAGLGLAALAASGVAAVLG